MPSTPRLAAAAGALVMAGAVAAQAAPYDGPLFDAHLHDNDEACTARAPVRIRCSTCWAA